MKIQTITDTNFKGYDARALKGFLMSSNCQNIALEMMNIGKKEGFKIYTVKNNKFVESLPKYSENTIGVWAQDIWTITKNKLFGLEYDKKFYAIKNALGLKIDFTEKICHESDTIRQLNQTIWDIFDELGKSENSRDRSLKEVTKDFEDKKTQLLKQQKEAHIPGGNMFIIRGDRGDEILIGKNELEKFSLEEISAMYGCEKVTALPQMDYHLDLFIRPLDKKRILVADDNKTLEVLECILAKLNKYIQSAPQKKQTKIINSSNKLLNKIKDFKTNVELNKLPSSDEICNILIKSGYKPIKVPARFYDVINNETDGEQTLQHICNYLNANTIKNKKKEIIYITNNSNIDSILGLTPDIINIINFSFEKAFINSISRFVKPNKIYFIKGDNNFVANEMLTIYQGGIHCASTEIPKGLKMKK